MHQKERNLVSWSHAAGPSSWSHRGPKSHLAQLPFSWSPSVCTLAFLATFQGDSSVRLHSNCQDDAASERVSEAGWSPWRPPRTEHVYQHCHCCAVYDKELETSGALIHRKRLKRDYGTSIQGHPICH